MRSGVPRIVTIAEEGATIAVPTNGASAAGAETGTATETETGIGKVAIGATLVSGVVLPAIATAVTSRDHAPAPDPTRSLPAVDATAGTLVANGEYNWDCPTF